MIPQRINHTQNKQNWKFHQILSNFHSANSVLQWVQNLTIFFLLEISQQIGLLGLPKFFAKFAMAGRLIEQPPNFFVEFPQTCGEQMLKIWKKNCRLLNKPACHSQFWPKLWIPLATLFVERFQKEKNWPVSACRWTYCSFGKFLKANF